MKRVISLYLPTLPTDRARLAIGRDAQQADTPLILLGREGGKRVVTAVDQAARGMGIAPGMAATQAQALFAGLHTQESDPKGDADALKELAQWVLTRYSPTVAMDAPDGLLIDATGCAHLFGGEQAMLSDLVARCKSAGFTAGAAMAPTYGAAYALVRAMRKPTVIASEASYLKMLFKLPIGSLRLPRETVDGLFTLGFETIGELTSKPRAPLALRFGKELGRILDQALGCAVETIHPVIPPEPIVNQQSFAEPITNPETIARYINKLTQALCRTLESKVLGARCLDLLFDRVDSHHQSMRIGLAKPRRDAVRLARLLCDKLETIDPGFGIEKMTLSAPWTEPLSLQQDAMELGAKKPADIASLVDTLSNRLGSGRVYKIISVESDVPERSIARVAPLEAISQTQLYFKWPRPAQLFTRPELIETIAMLPDHPPVSFTWRGVRHRIHCADGPERIFGEWWRRDAEMEAVRDYFKLEDDKGERFWVFRAGDGVQPDTGSHKWFMHGLFG